jgi:NhaP-type Na+/H+ or K+/H+ antiporter
MFCRRNSRPGTSGFLCVVTFTIVAFLLGGKLSISALREHGKVILWVSISVVLVTMVVVSGGMILVGSSIILALLLGGIATATDLAATQDVVRQEAESGPLTDTLTGIVAINDAWG